MKYLPSNQMVVTQGLEWELQDLLRQAAQARADVEDARSVLADLRNEIAQARVEIDFCDSAHLVEANEHLIVAAMQNQADAEVANNALSVLSRSYGMDTLTQLPNRVLLHERFVHAIAGAHRHHMRMAILFVDMDGFKAINDTFGHAIGDQVLQQTAHCIAHSIRDVDTVCRYGGDEFLVLITDVAQEADAVLVADKITQAVAVPITVDHHTMSISVSIGFCIYPDDGLDPAELIKCADASMYRAKRLKKAHGHHKL